MLLAVVSDPRLVLARLAEELVALRHARELPGPERERRALEARAIYAPLANRLGVWQLKWELEDLAFRYLEPQEYRRVAAALNERRADRERYIETLCAQLHARLRAAGIEAEVYGRPKHIYSIYRKMQRKQLAFEQLFDVRAVRVVVASVPECYGALGIVHGQWPYIPGEFDDYIATPKGNGYRSIHTAVIGPQGRSVEVQIRTPQMHEHAELGVAAHWTYKEGGARDAQYQRKIEWVRRLLEPHDGAAGGAEADRDLIEGMRTELFADRVYVLTPKARCSTCRAARHRSISPTASTPRSATAAAAPRRTGASCPSHTPSPMARSSRSSPAGTMPPAATGWHPSRATSFRRATAARCAPGSASRTWATTAAPAYASPNASSRASACAPSSSAPWCRSSRPATRITCISCSARARSPLRSCCRPPPGCSSRHGRCSARRVRARRGAGRRRCRSRARAICRPRWRAAVRRCVRSRSPVMSPSAGASRSIAATVRACGA